MHDIGWTHVALTTRDLRKSVAFYEQYADMHAVHERKDDGEKGTRVAWLTDARRAFVLVLIEEPADPGRLSGLTHLGIGCASRELVDQRLARAREEGLHTEGPHDSGYPVGYWAFIRDPDGHNLELSYGQEIGLTLARAGGE
ncbi:VOC family protein [Pendulispora rubella]|uniref:VOC family protein n=1 Tax=Pendulispora rubella TaxID=2741070 RepID=A0ABZ2L8P2_9BACT